MVHRYLFVLVILTSVLPVRAQVWELEWAEEFDTLRTDIWRPQIMADGGNNELQHYTDRPENLFVENGSLVIQALKERYTGPFGTRAYTSARVHTPYRSDWLYGRFEVRARLPEGKGLWPAIWMLPTEEAYGGWPNSGEIDIMEMLGHEPSKVYGSIHFGTSEWHQTISRSYTLAEGTFSDTFHVFAFEWEPEAMRWYVDGELYSEVKYWYSPLAPFPAPFDRPFHFVMNVAVGGTWPGYPDSTTVFPQRMYVDYVRVYKDASRDPMVTFSLSDSTAQPGTVLRLQAEATDPDGDVAEVVFYQDRGKMASVTDAPYALGPDTLMAGCYRLRVRAVDDEGRERWSPPRRLRVGPSCEVAAPYLLFPHRVPGRIEAEHFDMGGEGVGYHDADPDVNRGEHYRIEEGVDIGRTGDIGGAYYRVGWVNAGEWLSYTVRVPKAGAYLLRARMATFYRRAKLHVELDGDTLTEALRPPYTGGSDQWQEMTLDTLDLPAGVHRLRVVFDTHGMELDWIALENVVSSSTEALLPEAGFHVGKPYPNPADQMLWVPVESSSPTEISLEVYDLLGRGIRVRRGLHLSGRQVPSISVGDLAPGVYLLRVRSGHGDIRVRPFVKRR